MFPVITQQLDRLSAAGTFIGRLIHNYPASAAAPQLADLWIIRSGLRFLGLPEAAYRDCLNLDRP